MKNLKSYSPQRISVVTLVSFFIAIAVTAVIIKTNRVSAMSSSSWSQAAFQDPQSKSSLPEKSRASTPQDPRKEKSPPPKSCQGCGAMAPSIPGRDGKGNENSKTIGEASNIQLFKKVTGTDVKSYGMGGLRDQNYGFFGVGGVVGTVTQAYLYWHGVTTQTEYASGSSVVVNGVRVYGTSLGNSDDNFWSPPYSYSQAYRCDITSLVASNPNQYYTVSGFADYAYFNPNGVSLVIFHNDGNASNNRDVYMFEGNDSNDQNNFDADGWNAIIPGVNYSSGQAEIVLHVADGQSIYNDSSVALNSSAWLSGNHFSGYSVPSGDGYFYYGNGNLWDVKFYDITSFLQPGTNNLSITSPHSPGYDALSLVLATVSVPAVTGQVQSVVLEQIDSTIDVNPNLGGGSRIFPDRQSPADTVNRKRVRVKATTNLAPNTTIYFKSFDVDDPSANTSPVDSNGNLGDDNRGLPKVGTLSAVSAQTNVSGVATVELSTTMNPGDNFVVAASADQAYLNGVTVNLTGLKDSSGAALPTAQAKATSMLTVWRRLHIEVDSMGTVQSNFVKATINGIGLQENGNHIINVNKPLEPGRYFSPSGVTQGVLLVLGGARYDIVSNGSTWVEIATPAGFPHGNVTCWVFDDDDFNSNNPFNGDTNDDVESLADTFTLLQHKDDDPAKNILAPAYIHPEYDGGGSLANNQTAVQFKANIPTGTTNWDLQLDLGWNSEANERDDFWVILVQLAYQEDIASDTDPDPQEATGGGTATYGIADDLTGCVGMPLGGDGSLVFLETQRDVDLRGYDLKKRSMPHEVGHQLGLKGDNMSVPEFGVMNPEGGLTFGPRHLNVLRCRVKSPGFQP